MDLLTKLFFWTAVPLNVALALVLVYLRLWQPVAYKIVVEFLVEMFK